MLIPSIDLMAGKIVQLVQGEKKALEFDDFEYWVGRFAPYPLVQLIDLDAAMGRSDNRALIEQFVKRLPCQVGGGIHDPETVSRLLELGAQRVILGSVLFRRGEIQTKVARALAERFGRQYLTFAVDARSGRIAMDGWRTLTPISPAEAIRELEPYCSAFLYTHIDTEGLMCGFPLEKIRELKSLTSRRLICAGGIQSQEEVDRLDALGADAVVGMAIYSGKISV